MSSIIFPNFSDGWRLFSSLLESLHLRSSSSNSVLLTYDFLLGRGFYFSCSSLCFYLVLDLSRFFFWNSSSDSLFLLGIVYVSCIWRNTTSSVMANLVNISFNTLCQQLYRKSSKNATNPMNCPIFALNG